MSGLITLTHVWGGGGEAASFLCRKEECDIPGDAFPPISAAYEAEPFPLDHPNLLLSMNSTHRSLHGPPGPAKVLLYLPAPHPLQIELTPFSVGFYKLYVY